MKTSNAITRMGRGLFSKNVSTFITCLALASLLWLVRALNVNYYYTLNIPVKFTNLPHNKVIVGDLPEKIQVEIKTSGIKLFLISFRKEIEQLTIDFNSLKTNSKSQFYSMSNGGINLKSVINFNVNVLKIRPDTLFFINNKGNSKLVPVKVNATITCKDGYSLTTKIYPTPTFVSITGDSTALSIIDTVYTNELRLNNVTKNYEAMLALKQTATSVNYITKEVKVNFEVDRITESSIEIPIYIQHKTSLQPITLLPASVKVYYEVAMRDFNHVDANSFKAIVNYTDIKDKKEQLYVSIIRAPSELKIIKIEPRTVSYLIYKK